MKIRIATNFEFTKAIIKILNFNIDHKTIINITNLIPYIIYLFTVILSESYTGFIKTTIYFLAYL